MCVAGLCYHLWQGPRMFNTAWNCESWQCSWCSVSYFNIPCLGLQAPIMHYRCKPAFAHTTFHPLHQIHVICHLNYQLLAGTSSVLDEVLLHSCVAAKVTYNFTWVTAIQTAWASPSFLFIYLCVSVSYIPPELSVNHTSWWCPSLPFTLHPGGFCSTIAN